MSASTRDLVALPKVHVHAHLDGSYPLAAVRALARRRGIRFDVPEAYADVDDFFAVYGRATQLVDDLGDLAALCTALVHAEASRGVLFFEPAIEPQLYARLGSLREVTTRIVDALQAAAADAGVEVGANLTINTDQDDDIAVDLARIAASFAGRGVTALGTAGFVEPAGLARFVPAARIAQDAGLQIVSHAGQTGGPDSIEEALDVLGATRISHGIAAVDDEALVRRMAEQRIVCDVCPVSNVALGVAPSLSDHPARRLIAAGVHVTLNADDSLLFGRDVVDQYAVARDAWQLDDASLARVAGSGLQIPGMSAGTRALLERSLTSWLAVAA